MSATKVFRIIVLLTLLSLLIAGCSKQSIAELSPSAGSTFWVATAGTDNASCGSSTSPCKTIAHAVGKVNALGATNAPGSVVMVKNGTYNETSKIILSVSGTATNPITLKSENVVTDVNTAKNVTINYSGISINSWGQGAIEGTDVNYWIIEGFKVTSSLESKTFTHNGTSYTRQLPKIWAGILFTNSDYIIVRYNHTYRTGISGVMFRPKTTATCTDLDMACAVQNQGDKVLYNKIELTNQGWVDNINKFVWEQEALSMWGVSGGFEVAYNKVVNGTKEGIDIKLGRNGTVHHNNVQGVGAGIPSNPYIAPNGPGIYLDGRKDPMYNIKVYNNIVSSNYGEGITILTERPLGTGVNDVYNIDVYNNLVHGNSSTGIALGDQTRNVRIYHNTFAQNSRGFMVKTWYGVDIGGPEVPPKDSTIRNNIFANDTGNTSIVEKGANLTIDGNLGTYTINNVLYWNNCGSCVNASPNFNPRVPVTTGNPNPVKFVSLTSSTYFLGLQSTSPAINQGSTDTGPAPTDYDGISRTAYGVPDMGAYEFH